jgi:CRP/FNR family transcriptional regulator, cyclic AMP receptor protein
VSLVIPIVGGVGRLGVSYVLALDRPPDRGGLAAASVEASTRIEAHGVGRDRLLEMLDADSPAACKLVYEIDRTLAERMARTIATVAEVASRLETPGRSDDIDVFRDQLVQDWGF